MITNTIKTAYLLLAATTAASASALAGDVFKPASFSFSENDLVQQLSYSSGFSENVPRALYCQSVISDSGAASDTVCHDPDGNDEAENAAEDAMVSLSFEPATVNYSAVPVRMTYRILLNKQDDQLIAKLVPNLGSVQGRHGNTYVAPQERLDVADWYEEYSSGSEKGGSLFLSEGSLSRVSATIDEDGTPNGVRMIQAERGYKRDAKLLRNAVKKSLFIPGFVKGKPAEVGFLAVVNYNEE